MGPYSAVGGVSVHIKRLAFLLSKTYDVSFIDESPKNNSTKEVFNIRSVKIFSYLNLVAKCDIVHIHSGITLLRYFNVLAAFLLKKKVILSFHSINNLSSNKIIFLNKQLLPFCFKVICVSEEIKNTLKLKNGIVLPAFIPPNINAAQSLPDTLRILLETNLKKKIIVSNASRLDFL